MRAFNLQGTALNTTVHNLVSNEPLNEGCSAPPYSTDWSFGGPLIERECIELAAYDAETSQPKNPEYWEATIYQRNGPVRAEGTTPLIAAMRCYVASVLGEEVEISNEVSST